MPWWVLPPVEGVPIRDSLLKTGGELCVKKTDALLSADPAGRRFSEEASALPAGSTACAEWHFELMASKETMNFGSSLSLRHGFPSSTLFMLHFDEFPAGLISWMKLIQSVSVCNLSVQCSCSFGASFCSVFCVRTGVRSLMRLSESSYRTTHIHNHHKLTLKVISELSKECYCCLTWDIQVLSE